MDLAMSKSNPEWKGCSGKPLYDGDDPIAFVTDRLADTANALQSLSEKKILTKAAYLSIIDNITLDTRRLAVVVEVDQTLNNEVSDG